MEYLSEMIWYISLPITVWVALKFVMHNIKYFEKLERLEAYEKRYGTIEVTPTNKETK